MKLHVESEGDGRDVVLIHGWGMNGSCWDSLSERLSGYRIHLVDLPGHGASGYCEGDWVEMLAEAFPFEVSLCGWSLGGQLAMNWAFRYPERVKKLVLLSTTPCFVAREGWHLGVSAELLESFSRGIEKDREETLRRFLFLQAQGGEDEKWLYRKLRKIVKETEMEGLRKGLRLLEKNDFRKEASLIDMPVLLIHGRGDRLIPPEAAQWLCGEMRNAEIAFMPGCAHAPLVSHADACASLLTEFLDG